MTSLPPASPSMPAAETAHLTKCYQAASVILEYGSGGSTQLAAQMSGKLVFSVESDRDWARNLRQQIAQAMPRSQVIVYHVDIGPTGPWGRPLDSSHWQRFHRFPNAIWDAPFFRHPDLVLIDGRFRTACLMATMLRIKHPVTVLFDDYADRPRYHMVEQFLYPKRMIGRMAEFALVPGMLRDADMGKVLAQFFEGSVHGKGKTSYALTPEQENVLRAIK